MIFALNQVCPQHLSSGASEVWGRQLIWAAGERIGIQAASASGKTTLVNLLYGLHRVYQGEILIGERPAAALTAADWAKLRRERLAIVFQSLRLFPQLTARENIIVKAQLSGAPDLSMIEQMATELGISQQLDHPASRLSMGEQQRVAIVRALVQPFAWLLLDEPFSHLDPRWQTSAATVIDRRCAMQGAGIVITSLGGEDLAPLATTVLEL